MTPYKGLGSFDDTEQDALLFFGRERDTELIVANLFAARFTVLFGPTGVGKSSVLRAGVVRRARLLAPDSAVVVHDAWAGEPVRDLWQTVAGAVGADPQDDGSLAERFGALTAVLGGELYLVLDQFEELFTYQDGAAFARELAGVVTRPDLRVNALVAVRDDALSRLDVFTGLLPDVFGNALPVDHLDRESARAAITGPIARYNELAPETGISIEPELVDAVLDEVAVGRVVLGGVALGGAEAAAPGRIEAPYLQLVMQRLWDAERERGSSVLQRQTLTELGGAAEIVRADFDRALAALPAEERDVAARAFNHLVTPSGTKIAHRIDDLARYVDVDEAELRSVVSALSADRILRPLDGHVEIFHDVLADAILAWRAQHEAERAVDEQRTQAERRQRRILALLAVSLIGLTAMAALAVYALAQRGEARGAARRAEARTLDTQAGPLIPVLPAHRDPELGLLLAARAARLSPSPEAEDILRRALAVSFIRRVLPDRNVVSASFDRRGDRLVVGTTTGAVTVYKGDARTRLATFHTGARLRSAALSPDGRLLLAIAPGRTDVRIWRLPDGRPVTTLHQKESVRGAAFAPRGDIVITFGRGRIARAFDLRTGKVLGSFDQGGAVTSATVTPDERTLVTAGENRTARSWSLSTRRLLHEFRGHVGQVTSASVSPDGRRLLTTSTDETARVWRLADAALVTTLVGHTDRVLGGVFSRDGSSVLTWGSDGTGRLSRADNDFVKAILAGPAIPVTGASIGAGDTAVTLGADGRVRFWSVPLEPRLSKIATLPPLDAAAFSADGRIAVAAARTGVSIEDAADGRRLALIHAQRVRALAVNPDGALVAGAGRAGVSLWSTTGRIVRVVPGRVSAVAIEGTRALALGRRDGTITIRPLGGGRNVVLRGAQARVTSLAFSGAGDRVAAGFGDGSVAVWNVPARRRLFLRQQHRPGTAVTAVAFDRAGRRLATTGRDTHVFILDAAGGSQLQALFGHVATVSGASFSPDGHWLVTAGPGTAGLWDLVVGQQQAFLDGHRGLILAASFDATGRRVETLGADGTMRAYSCELCGGTTDLLRLAQQRLAATGRTLTPAERRQYLGRP